MPILKDNKALYPDDWPEIRQRILDRAKNKCEKCGLPNYAWVNSQSRELCLQDDDGAIRIILTIAHKDHDPRNCSDENLFAGCQKCHNNYDIPHRKQTRIESKNKGNYKIEFVENETLT